MKNGLKKYFIISLIFLLLLPTVAFGNVGMMTFDLTDDGSVQIEVDPINKLLTISRSNNKTGEIKRSKWDAVINGLKGENSNLVLEYDIIFIKSDGDGPIFLPSDSSGLFKNCRRNITFSDNVNTSKVTTMHQMFKGAFNFNQDLSVFNTENVTDMSEMFWNAKKFNYNLSHFNTSKVTNMNHMFDTAKEFDQDISSWDVSLVTDMSYMFSRAEKFNRDISSWEVSNVKNMARMFDRALKFNQDISSWDVSNVTNMRSMFDTASVFNQNISSWKVSNVTDMSHMFSGARSFNQNLNWDTESVTTMEWMFCDALRFNGNISSWNTENVTNMSHMFDFARNFNRSIDSWNVSNVQNMDYMFFKAIQFNQDLNSWNTKNVTTMEGMFALSQLFDGNISSWNTEKVTNMSGMFQGAKAFNQPLNWNTASVIDMSHMFQDAESFNQDLSSFNVSSVENMTAMFFKSSLFNQNLSSWNVSNVQNMDYMFALSGFNRDLSGWTVDNLRNANSMFLGSKFSGDISSWEMPKLETMQQMFAEDNYINKIIINSNHPDSVKADNLFKTNDSKFISELEFKGLKNVPKYHIKKDQIAVKDSGSGLVEISKNEEKDIEFEDNVYYHIYPAGVVLDMEASDMEINYGQMKDIQLTVKNASSATIYNPVLKMNLHSPVGSGDTPMIFSNPVVKVETKNSSGNYEEAPFDVLRTGNNITIRFLDSLNQKMALNKEYKISLKLTVTYESDPVTSVVKFSILDKIRSISAFSNLKVYEIPYKIETLMPSFSLNDPNIDFSVHYNTFNSDVLTSDLITVDREKASYVKHFLVKLKNMQELQNEF